VATLIIDNYDSFTYNLVDAVARIRQSAPIVVRNDELTWDEIQRLDFDSVIVSPGPGRPDNPRDFGVSAQVIAEANVPLLGVCLGHQGIARHFGGCVVRAAEPVHGRSAEIIHDGDQLFAGIPEHFSAIRYHSLIVGEPLPLELKKIAWTTDGAVMALRHVTRPIWGVQFHPESICTEYGMALLRNFLPLAHARGSAEPAKSFPAPRRTLKVYAHKMPLPAAPEALFRQLFADERYAFWLDSSLVSEQSRFSFMGTGHPEVHARAFEQFQIDAPPVPFQFTGGYVGYLGYPSRKHRSPFPEAYWLRVDRFLAIDHLENKLWIVSSGEPDDEMEKRVAVLKDCASPPPAASVPVQFELAREHDAYIRLIAECQARIAAGESYEICLTNQLRVRSGSSPLAYYETLRNLNPAPYSAYLRFDDIDIACSSPERFLRVDTSGYVESRPIKGTIRRGDTPQEDARLRSALACSEKNRAENLMIVDLVRNDLARVCIPGSVHVPQLMQVETYATVHQLVSTIAGQLAPGKTAMDCIRAAFPGGSMTGAPKLRTLEILEELEPEARGIYSGSIGYIGFNGAADLNIVIRTAVFHAGVASIGVGGAIVYQSQPEDEWDEMLLKAQALLTAFSAKLS
jgi:para-aminobenzoate synthetase